jgi:hypothetical protein
MATLQFPKDQYFLIKDSSFLSLGNISTETDIELSNIRLLIYKQGTIAADSTVYLTVRSASGIIIADSDVVTLADIPDFSTGNWYGRLRFDLNREFILWWGYLFCRINFSKLQKKR